MPSDDPTPRERELVTAMLNWPGDDDTTEQGKWELVLVKHRRELRKDPAFILPAAAALLYEAGACGLVLHYQFPKFHGTSYVSRGLQSLLAAYRSLRRKREEAHA